MCSSPKASGRKRSDEIRREDQRESGANHAHFQCAARESICSLENARPGRALVRLQGIGSTVIATGGGIVTQPRNLPLLRTLGQVVWLSADQTTIVDRVGKSTHRPMLDQANPEESVTRLLAERAPLYRQAADLLIETSGLTHREVADRIVLGLDKFRASNESRTA